LALSKRLLPIIYKAVDDTELPLSLRRLQFIRFDSAPGITRPLAYLADALRRDLEWIREHTRIGELAARWQARGQPTSLLLHGEELSEVRAWASKRKAEAPDITDHQRAFLDASEKAEVARLLQSRTARRLKRRMQALVGLLGLGIIFGLLCWLNQVYLLEQWRWFTTIRPYVTSQSVPMCFLRRTKGASRVVIHLSNAPTRKIVQG
jgi:hypothetical protein